MRRLRQAADLPDQAGRRILITGANRGLGLEMARALAARGATLLLACRDPGQAEAAARHLGAQYPAARITAECVDLARLDSLARLAARLLSRGEPLHALVHNAAVILAPRQASPDGFESHIAVNHHAPFALTRLLLPLLVAARGRVVLMSSLAHALAGPINPQDLDLQHTPYTPMEAYARSKLAVLLFGLELDRRLQAAGLPVRARMAHPGYAATNTDLGGFWLRLTTRLIAQPARIGALPALQVLCDAGHTGGDYWGPGGLRELRGLPAPARLSAAATDPALARDLWNATQARTQAAGGQWPWSEPGRI